MEEVNISMSRADSQISCCGWLFSLPFHMVWCSQRNQGHWYAAAKPKLADFSGILQGDCPITIINIKVYKLTSK